MINAIETEFDQFDEDSDEIPVDNNLPYTVYKCKEMIHDNLLSSGQRDLLKRMIQNRLAQTGWTYSLRMECIEYIKRRGVENVNVSHMVEDLHGVGRARFPDDLKKELYNFLMEFAKTYLDVDESAPPPTEADIAYSNSSFIFNYQGRDVIPDPGLGDGVVSSTTEDSASGSSPCSSHSMSSEEDEEGDEGSPSSRSSTPQPSSDLPLLLPENFEMLEAEHSGSEEEDDVEGEMEGEEEEEELECDADGEEVYLEGYDVEITQAGEDIEGGYLIGDPIEFEGDCEGVLGYEEIGDGGIEVELDEEKDGEEEEHEEEEGSSSNNTNNEEVEDDEIMDV